jgi:hypothetical protein
VLPPDNSGITDEKWGVFLPAEVNPGEVKMKRGVVLAQPFEGGTTDRDGKETLSVVPMVDRTKYHFQVGLDKEFKTLFLESIGEPSNYVLEKPVAPRTTCYWRARLIHPDGSLSAWSEVRSLTNEYGAITP